MISDKIVSQYLGQKNFLVKDGNSLASHGHFTCVFSPSDINKVAHNLAGFAISLDKFGVFIK